MGRIRLILFVLLLPLVCAAQAVKDLPRPVGYVSDDAHVLSPVTVDALDRLCLALDRQAHAQMAVVTVENTDNEPVSEYAVALEDAWKVGPKASDRGLILLVSVADRHYFILTGYGLEGTITDERAGIIGRQMEPYLHAGDYDAGMTLAARSLAGLIAQSAGVRLDTAPVHVHEQISGARMKPGQMIILAGALLLFLVLAARTGLLPFLFGMFLGGGFGGGGRGGGGDGGGGGGGFDGFGGGSTGGGGAGGSF